MRISTKLALLLLAVSLLPLTVFGLVSLWQVRQATVVSVTEGNANVSRRAADEIDQYVHNALTILESTAETMSQADLQGRQQERILKNYINRFDEFNEISLWDADGWRRAGGRPLATSRLEPREIQEGERRVFQQALKGVTTLSPVFIKEDLTPAMIAAAPVRRLAEVSGLLVAELDLLQMWYLVDGIRIAKKGILHVLDAQGRLIASGDGARKKDVFLQKRFEPRGEIDKIFGPGGTIFRNPAGVKVLAVGARLVERPLHRDKTPLFWSVIVEQPTSEAYALATRISYLLAAIMAGMILVAFGLGIYGGRRHVVDPIRLLTRATEELARGNLAHRVTVATGDEFALLAESFNQMAIRLKEARERLIQEERHSMFGRIASGLAHDLKHPIQAIENVSRLMEKMYGDPAFRRTFRRTVEREFAKITLFLQNLHNLTHEVPYRPIPLSLNHLLRETWATFEMEAARQGILVDLQIPAEEIRIQGDRTALNRVFSNLISNALQSMTDGGRLTVSCGVEAPMGGIFAGSGREAAIVRVQDTGVGIPPERMATLFDDFVTTKRRGLGLGLAITRKLILQHQGKIDVESQPGVGTTFQVSLPQPSPPSG